MCDNFSYFEKDRTNNLYFFLFLSDPWLLLFENSILFSLILIWLIIISDANNEDGDDEDDDEDEDEDGEGAWDNGDIGKY